MHSFKELLKYIWRRTKTIVIFLVGVALIAAGLVMLVMPGPGLLVIIAGLAVLATEFAWAEAMLDKAKEKAADDVLAAMLRGLGATVTPLRAPFEPEAGAYAAGHHSHSSDAKHAGIIHDFATRDRRDG